LTAGLALSEALALVKPPSGPLEGSSLAYVYNPVFVVGSAGQTLKGWTDFAGGGMAVFEDRFSAANRFEHWAFERVELRGLWQPLVEAHAHDGDRLDLPALAATLDARASQQGLLTWLGWFLWRRGQSLDREGWDSVKFCISAAMGNWQHQAQVAERRSTAASNWPTSFAELQVWLTPEPRDVGLPADWTNDRSCVAFTTDLVAIGRKWLTTMGPAV
jgi:hypothetical protein